MPGDENPWKWKKFVEIGNTIHKLRGVIRLERAKDALGLVQDLRESGFLRSSEERFDLYETLLPNIAC
jgi:hypothetical protein